MKHVLVYDRPGVFAGWPANNGVWDWSGQEILVGLTVGLFEEKPGHNINEPYRSVLARSPDQGDSWTLVEPKNFVGCPADPTAVTDRIDFASPGFAMRVVGSGYHGSYRPAGAFLVSTDRGDTWRGPHSFGALVDSPELQGLEITARTDGGATWGADLVLRDDFHRDRVDEPDLGYARLVRRADGKMVACCYWATAERPHQHIAATLWSPDEPAEPRPAGVVADAQPQHPDVNAGQG